MLKDLKSIENIEGATFHPDKYADLFNRKIELISDGEVFEV